MHDPPGTPEAIHGTSPMLEDLTQAVAREAGLTPQQAAMAVTAILRFLTARLPSAFVGQLHEKLGTATARRETGRTE